METINIQLDISGNTGKRLFREIQKHPKVAKIEYPVAPSIEGAKTYSLEEVFEECYDRMNEHYCINVRKL